MPTCWAFVLRHIPSKQKEVNDMTRNSIGVLEIAFEISTAKANGCDQGICSCEGDDCLAKGWEAFLPPQELLLDEKRRDQLQIAFTSLVPMRLPIP